MIEPVEPEIEEAASRWLARLDADPVSPQERAAFEAWRSADPRHAATFARLQAVWRELDDPRSFPAEARSRSARRPYVRAGVALAATAAVAAVVVMLGPAPSEYGVAPAESYLTPIGAHQRLPLADGSVVELNTDTEITVTLDDHARRVDLLRGEATFRVAQDSQRPFTVKVGELSATAVGTAFNVRSRPDAVELLVIEGRVRFGSALVDAGQRAVATAAEIEIRALSAARIESLLAWQKGMLAFDDAPLTEVADEFNRYNAQRLVVDPGIATLRVGGYFQTTNVEGFVRVLERNFAVQATPEPGSIRLSPAP
jgi:transmembrane sensor